MRNAEFDLRKIFDELNLKHFDGWLDPPALSWNSRLRSAAGRCRLPLKKGSLITPKIEIASYLQKEKDAELHIRNTVAHEMIHYWLWVRGRPFGHTREFLVKMKEMGAPRFNPIPKLSGKSYQYACKACGNRVEARKKWKKKIACARCCKKHAGGKYHSDYRLELVSLD